MQADDELVIISVLYFYGGGILGRKITLRVYYAGIYHENQLG